MEQITRENARPVNKYWHTLDECIDKLLEYKRNNQSVVTDFNGHKLYSCDITVDSAYKEVLGYTKTEQQILANEEELMKLIVSQCDETTLQNMVKSSVPSKNVLHHFQLPSGLHVYSESIATFDMQAPKKLSLGRTAQIYVTSASVQTLDNCNSQSLDAISVEDSLILQTQPYVKYDTKRHNGLQYSISDNDNGEARVSIGESREDGNTTGLQYFTKQADRQEQGLGIESSEALYMSDIFMRKIEDTPVLTEETREKFAQKAQVLVDMLSVEKNRQSEIKKAIGGIKKIEETEQEIDALTQQLDEMKTPQKSGDLEPDKEV